MTNIAIEAMVIEIVNLPIDSMVDLSIVLCKRFPEAIPKYVGYCLVCDRKVMLLTNLMSHFLL